MYGLTRGTMTLIGVGAAAFLFWLATWIGTDSLGEYWAFVGLMAGAGLAMALSQLLGGWTKWGMPRITASVFLLGFLPALLAGGLVILDAQPDESAVGTGWAEWLNVGGTVETFFPVVGAIAFLIGLTFGFSFDTTGPRVRREEEVEERGYVGPVPHRTADEPTTAEREEVATVRPGEDRYVGEPDREPGEHRHAEALVGGPPRDGDRRVEMREGGRPAQPYRERESRFRNLFRR